MGILDMNICPDPTCPHDKKLPKDGFCPECGTKSEKIGSSEAGKILKMKKKIDKGHKSVLFSDEMSNDEIKSKIFIDMANLSMQEAGTKWMHAGALLSFNSTDQIIASGFKAIIDQNKLIIRQNELILRELRKNSK